MTLELLRNEIWQQIGEPTDLDPTTDIQYGGLPLLTWVANEGQRQIAFWKDPATQRIYRHPQLEGEFFFQAKARDETLEAQTGMATNQILLPAGVSTTDDAYVGWVLATASETKLVVDYVGATRVLTLDSVFTTAPAVADVVSLCPRKQYMVLSTHALAADNIVLPVASDRFRAEGNFLEVLQLKNVTQGQELRLADRVRDFDLYAVGAPTLYARVGNMLVFNSAWDTQDWLKMDYYRAPTEMVLDDDEPELAEPFHYAIALWGLAWGFRRAGDNASAYAVKRDIGEYIQRTASLGEVRDMRRNDYGKLRRG